MIRGDTVISKAIDAMKILTYTRLEGKDGSYTTGYPYVFVTNGGGCTEKKKAKQLSQWLGVNVPEDRVILSHTPMQQYSQFHKKNVLLVGQGPVKEIAANYGFTLTLDIEDIVSHYPLLSVMDKSKTYNASESSCTLPPIDAVFVLMEPTHWEANLQILMDVLTSDGTIGTSSKDRQVVPIFFTNPDFLWMAQHPQPRFGQGAFKLCLESLYKRYTGRQLESEQFGKPHDITYKYALCALNEQMKVKAGFMMGMAYGVGDNPTSDIRGANDQEGMLSIMVRTGVFDGCENDPDDPADYVVDDVLDAVTFAIKRNNK
eukprot:CFRG6484T1